MRWGSSSGTGGPTNSDSRPVSDRRREPYYPRHSRRRRCRSRVALHSGHGVVDSAIEAVHGRHTIVEQLDSGQIHLWLAWLGQIADSRLLAEYRSLLSEEELDKQARFHFERDRHRYLVTRAMVRAVLSKYVVVEPRDWKFVVNDYGKPSVAAEHSEARGIEFNLSHTDELVVLGVTRGRMLGVDVENVRAREVDLEIADRFFAPAELAALRALPSQQQQQRFFDYWTLKESYVKARGMGLSIPLGSFAFRLEDPAPIRLTIDPSLQDRTERWLFWQRPLGRGHLMALCAENCGAERPSIEAYPW
jgi:4'-phosphopantetheinyl transferase